MSRACSYLVRCSKLFLHWQAVCCHLHELTKSYGGASKLGKAYGLALASEGVANIGKSQGPNNLDWQLRLLANGY